MCKPNKNSSQPIHLLEGVFNGILYLRANPEDKLQFSTTTSLGNGFRENTLAQ
jgi:hypothetical protein